MGRDGMFPANVCRDYMHQRCSRGDQCRYIHDSAICFQMWKHGTCKLGDLCRKKHALRVSTPSHATGAAGACSGDGGTTRRPRPEPEPEPEPEPQLALPLLLQPQAREESWADEVARTEQEEREQQLQQEQQQLQQEQQQQEASQMKPAGRTRLHKAVFPAAPGRSRSNTTDFEPLRRPVDMRVVVDVGRDRLARALLPLTPRDVVLAPNLFSDFQPGEMYARLTSEMRNCGVPMDDMLKLWHGDIADDRGEHARCKDRVPTFELVRRRVEAFFDMDIQATRFNWYQDTSKWKPFHHDAAAVKERQAATQNFTVAVSFGATRDVAFEDASRSRVVISFPQPDGCTYAFARDTNMLWKHGVLQDPLGTRQEGRVSCVFWGSVRD